MTEIGFAFWIRQLNTQFTFYEELKKKYKRKGTLC